MLDDVTRLRYICGMSRPKKDSGYVPKIITHTRLDPATRTALERIAEREQRNVSWLINEVMTKWVQRQAAR